ncbi:hypothetical protein QAD02_009957 [Eretmocerus hayati]|uniref:Uncharacterized protein n=1 Tax=Eretmocerus hayati TaxID=131215 RepID=A0ACC2NB68_9HYME|nr:hypothetical protein QAD02_009957 [Eretmocerus hayati]
MGNFAQFMNDPEILMAFQDPDVAEAFKDISSNPGNMFKYQSNPKIMAIITKMATKFGGAGGMPGMGGMGGMPGMGGMGGMPNFGGGAAPTSQSSGPACNEPDEFGLD